MIGRVTVAHQEKLDNEAVIQERSRIESNSRIAEKELEKRQAQIQSAKDSAALIKEDVEEHQSKVVRLIQEMRKDSVENFTVELPEVCPAERLDEKERLYIDFYTGRYWAE